MATLKDVAKRAGVSPAAASRAWIQRTGGTLSRYHFMYS